jgi:hypothetical protein
MSIDSRVIAVVMAAVLVADWIETEGECLHGIGHVMRGVRIRHARV